MYEAKNTGRECYKFYSGELSAAIERRNYLESFLRDVVPNGYLEVYYQPKVDIQQGFISGFEALSRFKHPQEGFLSPFELYTIAEETGTIHLLGDYVLKSAMSQTQIWHDQGIWQGRMAINVSPVQIFESTFYERFIALIEETGVNPKLIELEITEGIFIDNPEKAKQLLEQFRALGISIAIDDFGTGYSSLAYITQLPIDNLKIDRTFITQIEEGVKYEGMLISIIQMAHHLGLKVTAEGIEKVEHLQFLHTHNCQDIQGYLYSKPLVAKDAEAILKEPKVDVLLSSLI
jgi:EAL domain-containing protein (putative c-di-GMP-specific phosphodiesterase class I)